MWTNNNCLERRNNVSATLHINIYQHYGIKTSKTPWKHHPQPITKNEEVKVLWDFEILTDKVMTARRPDIIVVDKTKHASTIMDVAASLDRKVKDKDEILKYQDLNMKIHKLWKYKS